MYLCTKNVWFAQFRVSSVSLNPFIQWNQMTGAKVLSETVVPEKTGGQCGCQRILLACAQKLGKMFVVVFHCVEPQLQGLFISSVFSQKSTTLLQWRKQMNKILVIMIIFSFINSSEVVLVLVVLVILFFEWFWNLIQQLGKYLVYISSFVLPQASCSVNPVYTDSQCSQIGKHCQTTCDCSSVT